MKVKDLIEALKRHNEDTEVCIFDIKRHEFSIEDNPHGEGIEANFNVVLHTPDNSKRFIAIEYVNPDYDEYFKRWNNEN